MCDVCDSGSAPISTHAAAPDLGETSQAASAATAQQARPASEQQGKATDPQAKATNLHERIRQLVRIERQATREIAVGMAAMHRELLYRELGYAGLVEYGEQAFGFRPSKTRQLARLGRLLPDLPVLDEALRSGALGWTKARTVAQVATSETERAWVERALQVTSRELEDLVACADEGDEPPDPTEEWEPPRHIWARIRLDPFHFERLMQVLALARHHLGDPDMSVSQLLLYMAERCLDGDLLGDGVGAGLVEHEAEGEQAVPGAAARAVQDRHQAELDAGHGGGDLPQEQGRCEEPAAEACHDQAHATAHVCGEAQPQADRGDQAHATAHVCDEAQPQEDSGDQAHAMAHVCDEAQPQAGRGDQAHATAHVCDEAQPQADRGDQAHAAAHVCREIQQEADRGDQAHSTTHVCHEGEPEVIRGGISEQTVQARSLPSRGENAYATNYRIIEHRCPSCDKAWTEGRAGRIELDERDRALAECDAEVVAGDESAGTPGHMSRTIPPAIRRAVLIRDGGRCQVPGCRHKKHIELHHIVPWAISRSHDPGGLVSLCSTHHAMVHKDVLHVSRDQDGALRWERGFGEPLGVVASIWGEHGELEQADLAEFEGPPGSWPLLRGLWGPIEPPEAGRVPRGRQQIRIGDDQRMAASWMARNIPV